MPHEQQESTANHDRIPMGDAPPERVGLLLAEARTTRGLGLAEVAAQLDAGLDAAQLMALESGALEVDRSVIDELSRTYGVEPDALVPPRNALVIDLNEGYLRAGPDIALLTDGAGVDSVLARYLEMVWELRSVDPGTVVPLRGADIAVLARQLGVEPELVEAQLRRKMAEKTHRRRSRVLIGLGAAILAITGGVIAWQATGEDAPETEPTAVQEVTSTTSSTTVAEAPLPPAPTAEIGEAEVLERDSVQGAVDAGGAAGSGAPSDLDALPPAPTAEIGDAATLERDSVPPPAPAAPEAPRTDLESLAPAPSASIGDAAVQERNPDGTPGEQLTR